MARVLELAKSDYYEHKLVETCCDLCGQKTQTPVFFKVEATWQLWFFCSKEHQYAFGKRGSDGIVTLQ